MSSWDGRNGAMSAARRGATLLLGLATLSVVVGWFDSDVPAQSALFSWQSYSTHAIRMNHNTVWAHGKPVHGPAVILRRLHDPAFESKDYPYPTNDGTPQWPSNAPMCVHVCVPASVSCV